MRAAISVVIAVVAACGGGGKPSKPIENVAVPVARPWTVARVRSTVPSDTSVMFKVDTAAIRASAVLGPLWSQLSAASLKNVGACPEVVDLDATLVGVVSGSTTAPVIGLWVLDTTASTMRRCIDTLAAAPPPGVQITVDSDYVSITKTGPEAVRGGVLFLDERTAFVTFEKVTSFDRARLLAATQERPNTLLDPALDHLVESSAPVWGYGTTSAPMLGAVAASKFRTFAVTVGLEALVSVDARVRMPRAEDATSTAQAIQSQGQGVKQMGMIDELTASAEADVLVVHAVFSKTALDKMMQMFSGILGGGGMAPFGPPTGP